MKKLLTSKKWKNYLAIRSKDAYKKKTRKHLQGEGKGFSRKNQIWLLTANDPDHFEQMFAPETFSFINKPDDLLLYLKDVKETIASRKQVFLDKSKIKLMTSDAIALLVANLKDKWFHRGIKIMGNAPEDGNLERLFLESGFYNYVQSRVSRQKNDNLLLHHITKNKVEPEIAKRACLIGLKHTFENEEIFEPLYEVIIECMSNTNFHAGLDNQGKYDWWLYVYKNPENKVTSYTFLDLGVGIFESIPFKNYVKFLKNINIVENTYLVDDLLNGKIKSRTKEEIRGKGLPQIYQHSKHKNIKNFKLISNDVFADFDTKNYYSLKNDFNGTFLYWELHPDE